MRSVANPAKTAHLKALPGAADRLKLFEADLLKAGSFDEALAGCSECHHTASPFFNDGVTDAELQLIRPAVEGTLNVLGSCKKNGVRTIVVTSSTAAVYGRREGNPAGHVITEAQWADEDLAAENKVHYVVSKIKAERAVWAFAEKEFPEARIVAVNPTLVVGPMLQPVMNTSSAVIAGVRVSPAARHVAPRHSPHPGPRRARWPIGQLFLPPPPPSLPPPPFACSFCPASRPPCPPATSPSWTSGTSWQRTSQPQSAIPPRAGIFSLVAWRSGPTSSVSAPAARSSLPPCRAAACAVAM